MLSRVTQKWMLGSLLIGLSVMMCTPVHAEMEEGVAGTTETSQVINMLNANTPTEGTTPAVAVQPTKEIPTEIFGVKKMVVTPSREAWIRAGLAFIFVTTLILMLGGIFKFMWNRVRMGKKSASPLLRVTQTIPMGMKRHLVVVEFAGRQLLVGAQGNQMQLLYAIDKEGESASPIERAPQVAPVADPVERQIRLAPVATQLPDVAVSKISTANIAYGKQVQANGTYDSVTLTNNEDKIATLDQELKELKERALAAQDTEGVSDYIRKRISTFKPLKNKSYSFEEKLNKIIQ